MWAAYGNRIPRALLESVNGRAVNVHASLLPRWRGAAPIAHAILAGDRETGVTLMEGTAALDEGPILAQERTPIGEAESAGDLTRRLAVLGAGLLERELPRYIGGELPGTPQDGSMRRCAPKLTSRDGELGFRAARGGARSSRARVHAGAGRVDDVSRRASRRRGCIGFRRHAKGARCARDPRRATPRSQPARAGYASIWCVRQANGR